MFGNYLRDDAVSHFKGCRLTNVLHVHFNFILRLESAYATPDVTNIVGAV